ncbi:hypothetical protein [Microvirga massiliensis]|uniref:hypothetical protein n=1 Tax=Microvirga massiliensis TaxID=1033741 RepID=UPI00062B74DB|nr:hypothetical protein [Microvirga massiliensis]
MARSPDEDEEQAENRGQVGAPQLDKLERLANAARTAAQAKQWRARKDGLQDESEPSEVRNLTHDAEARAQAEAAMQKMMAKSAGKRSKR